MVRCVHEQPGTLNGGPYRYSQTKLEHEPRPLVEHCSRAPSAAAGSQPRLSLSASPARPAGQTRLGVSRATHRGLCSRMFLAPTCGMRQNDNTLDPLPILAKEVC